MVQVLAVKVSGGNYNQRKNAVVALSSHSPRERVLAKGGG